MKWTEISDIVQGVSSVLSLILTAVITLLIQQYTKRKDRLDYLSHKWAIQQDINLQTIGDPNIALKFEQMVYGDSAELDEGTAHRHFALFLIINLVQSDWFALQQRMISPEEFEQSSLATLGLIVRRRETIEYLLEHRNYPKGFADAVKRLLLKATPPPPFPGASTSVAKST